MAKINENDATPNEIISADDSLETNSLNKTIASDPNTKLQHNISIEVQTEPLPEESDFDKGMYAFTYTLTLANVGTESVQLINRHWKVFSNKRQIADVKGEGVVGQQPLLHPGDSFEYTSWTIIPEPIGMMKGAITFQSDSGIFFDVEIKEFVLRLRDATSLH